MRVSDKNYGKKVIKVLRDFIIVEEENGKHVKYVRAPKPQAKTPKPKRVPKAKPTAQEATNEKLRECRAMVVKCHKLTEQEIETRTRKSQSFNQNAEIDELVDLFSRNWFSVERSKVQNQQTALVLTDVKTTTEFDWINREDTIKITVGSSTLFISADVFRKKMSQILSNVRLIDMVKQTSDIKWLIDMFSRDWFGAKQQLTPQVQQHCSAFTI